MRRARPFAPQRSAYARPQQLHVANDPELAALERLADRLDVDIDVDATSRLRRRTRALSAASRRSRPLGAQLVESSESRHLRGFGVGFGFAGSGSRPSAVSAHYSLT